MSESRKERVISKPDSGITITGIELSEGEKAGLSTNGARIPPTASEQVRPAMRCEHVVTDGACECARCLRCNAHVYEVVRDYRLQVQRLERARDSALMYRSAGWMLFAATAGSWLGWHVMGWGS